MKQLEQKKEPFVKLDVPLSLIRNDTYNRLSFDTQFICHLTH